jgi:hypothetical protein
MKKCDRQNLARSEREQQQNCSGGGDVTFHNDRSRAPVLGANKHAFLFSKRGLVGGVPLLEHNTDHVFPQGGHLSNILLSDLGFNF